MLGSTRRPPHGEAPRRPGSATWSRMWRSSLGLGLGAWLGCDAGVFVCQDDSSCVLEGEQGVCQASGYCSFPDDDCTSGQRYGELVGRRLSGICVEEEDAYGGIDSEGGPNPNDGTGTGGGDESSGGDGSSDDAGAGGPYDGVVGRTGVECQVDEFGDGVPVSGWCTDLPAGIVLSEHEDVLQLDLVPEHWSGGEQFGQIRSCESLPLIDVSAVVEVEQVPQLDRHTEGYLEVGNDALGLGVAVIDDHIYVYTYEGDDSSEAAWQRYEPESQRYWRVRGAPEGLVAEVSPDGVAWVHLHTLDVDLVDELGIAMLGVWSDRAPPQLDAARYQRFEVCGFPG